MKLKCYKWCNQHSHQQKKQQKKLFGKCRWPYFLRGVPSKRLGVAVSGISIGLLCSGLSPVIAQERFVQALFAQALFAQGITTFDLDQAICANNWPEAISLVTMLMAQETTTGTERCTLLSLRRQLERYQRENVLVADELACERSDAYYLRSAASPNAGQAPDQTSEPLGWENAVIEATENRFNSEIITESVDLTLPITTQEIQGLTAATPVDLSQGLNVVSGHVGQGHNVYSFVAGLGDRLEANLNVTRVMTGSLYTSDDSQLFIFDRHGNLIAAADDTDNSPQSRLTDIPIPKTDLYFAVVTTYNNDPVLDRSGRLTGWQDNGGGRFDYTLTLSGVTPTNELVR